jgi:biotin transport system ATP-binding protein
VLGLCDINLTLTSGEFVVVAGPNGAGKSLLMRHLVGLADPTSGDVLWQGVDVRRQLPEVRRNLGLVFQDSGAQILGLTVREDVAFGPRNLGWSREEVALAVAGSLATVGLSEHIDQPCAQLSGGELRRLAIAGILAMDPRLVVLDEPFTGLDYPGVQAVLRALMALQASGITLVVLTHELDKCLALATRLVLMSQGKVLADGSPASLWERIPEAQVHRPVGPVTLLETMTWLV